VLEPLPRTLCGSALPYRLADLEQPPELLYLRGELPRGPAVAIVGTRRPTRFGTRFAEALGHDLARAGVAVLSGGAAGIDTAAHEGALRARGTTVAVGPAGWRRPFPSENKQLFERIVRAGGGYLSLVADTVPATQAAFFARNACLVALSNVVVVVEAGFRSGALNAARWARELGRPVLVVPHSPWNKKGRGCIVELRRGASICEGPVDVLRQLDRLLLSPLPLGDAPVQPNLPLTGPPGLQADANRVRAAIAAGATNVDEIMAVTELSPAVVQRQILTLTLAGVLAPDRSGRLSLTCVLGSRLRSKS
jgi:DNA processing protein